MFLCEVCSFCRKRILLCFRQIIKKISENYWPNLTKPYWRGPWVTRLAYIHPPLNTRQHTTI